MSWLHHDLIALSGMSWSVTFVNGARNNIVLKIRKEDEDEI